MLFVRFYYGRTLPALAVRWATRRPGQRLRDVPSHCALEWGGVLYEFTAAGFGVRYGPEARCRAWGVPLPKPAALASFLDACRGERYDWWAILLGALHALAPDGIALGDHLTQEWDCSRFAVAALVAGGWTPPASLANLSGPPSPNDLLLALRG